MGVQISATLSMRPLPTYFGQLLFHLEFICKPRYESMQVMNVGLVCVMCDLGMHMEASKLIADCCTCSRTLAVSSGMVKLSATQPARPALTNFTPTPGLLLPFLDVDIFVRQVALPPTRTQHTKNWLSHKLIDLQRIDYSVHNYSSLHSVYDTIRDAILTCARKPTWVSLIYRTETTTKKCKNREKTKTWKTDMLRSNSKQSGGR